MSVYRDFRHAEEFITSCTNIKQMRDFFLDKNIRHYFERYIDKCYGNEKRKKEQEVYIAITSKQDVINRQNFTQKMIDDYEINFNRGDCNKGCLENAVISIEISFSEYIIALRKLLDFNTEEHFSVREYKCSVEEAKGFMQESFKYIDEVSKQQLNTQMMDY